MASRPAAVGANPPLPPAVLLGRETSCRRLVSPMGYERLTYYVFHTRFFLNMYSVFLFIGVLIPL